MKSSTRIYNLPINKSIKLNNKRFAHISDGSSKEQKVSVISCTNRNNTLYNIKKNFFRQDFNNKELIIILNNNAINKEFWEDNLSCYDNVSVFQLDQAISLGNCLNFAVSKSKYPIIAKFDDDDYYGEKYLLDSIKPFLYTDAKIVGKYTTYVYFKKDKVLAIRNPKREHMFSYRVEGSTLLFKKDLFDTISFSNRNLGEDIQLCKDCIKAGFRIYSHNKLHHVYIRHGSSHNHTFGMSDSLYINLCKKIAITDNFKKYLNF
ncbi:glycosyltransferase [Clostridiaceae bacterium M8S5]|nr:glycosyltransferase [Clostridiaceae bacterium M8S5]